MAQEEKKLEEVETVSGHAATINDYDVLRGPIHTEKTQTIQGENNAIVLEVKATANKTEIKKAVESIFGVKVEKVNTINVSRKEKTVGRYKGFVRGYKKAIVYLDKATDLAEIAKAAHAE